MAGSSVRKLLLSKGVIPLLLERLNDSQYEVFEESLGALRNLAAVEPSVAKEYYNRDILTALGALLPKVDTNREKEMRKSHQWLICILYRLRAPSMLFSRTPR